MKRYDVTDRHGSKIGEAREVTDLESTAALYLTLAVLLLAVVAAVVAVVIVVATAAIVAGLIAAALVGLGVLVMRLFESIQGDLVSRHLSLTTVGLGVPMVTLPICVALVASGPVVGNPAFFALAIFFEVWLVGLIGFVPARCVRSLLRLISGNGTVGNLVAWGIATAVELDFVVTYVSERYRPNDALDAANTAAMNFALPAAMALGAVFGFLPAVSSFLRPEQHDGLRFGTSDNPQVSLDGRTLEADTMLSSPPTVGAFAPARPAMEPRANPVGPTMASWNLQCPRCEEQIPADSRICRFCRFQVLS